MIRLADSCQLRRHRLGLDPLGFDHRVGHLWRLSSMLKSANASFCGDEEGKSGTSRGGARAPCSAPSAMALAGRQSLRASLQAQARYKDSLLRPGSLLSPGSWGLRGCAPTDTGAKMPFEFPSMLPLLSSPLAYFFFPTFSGQCITSPRAVWRLLWRPDLASPMPFHPCGCRYYQYRLQFSHYRDERDNRRLTMGQSESSPPLLDG
jgi:hypothetical protein